MASAASLADIAGTVEYRRSSGAKVRERVLLVGLWSSGSKLSGLRKEEGREDEGLVRLVGEPESGCDSVGERGTSGSGGG